MLLKKGNKLRKEKTDPKRYPTRLKIFIKKEEDKNDNYSFDNSLKKFFTPFC